MSTKTQTTAVVVPNWNGKEDLPPCLDSLLAQTHKAEIVVVENGSIDGSLQFIREHYPDVTVLPQPKNLGFAGGVNVGIRYALEKDYEYIALFNNDAMADKNWLKELVATLKNHPRTGIATCKFQDMKKKHLDSTGEHYTTWGLSYPRGRGEPVSDTYDAKPEVFGATGGASLYRSEMLRQIGLFDEDFFAYYEDVDISFRAQLAGWTVRYAPEAIAYHQIGATSGKIRGFTTRQTLKNIPWVLWKNVPLKLLPTVLPRFTFAYCMFVVSALGRGQVGPALEGSLASIVRLPKKLWQRRAIQRGRKISDERVEAILTWDLPPNATKLRNIRAKWWKLRGKKS